jgi:hypothetical protein
VRSDRPRPTSNPNPILKSPMSYAAALDQLNAMAPELYAKAGQPRRKFSLDKVRILLARSAIRSGVFPRADCGDQREGLDGGDAGIDPDRSGTAHRTLHFTASQ